MTATGIPGRSWQGPILSAMQTLAWGFLCLHGFIISQAIYQSHAPRMWAAYRPDGWYYVARMSDFAALPGTLFAVIAGTWRYSMPPVRWWRMGAPFLGMAAAIGLVSVAPGTLYLMPLAGLLAWGAVGLLVSRAIGWLAPQANTATRLMISAAAGCATGIGIELSVSRIHLLSYGGEQTAIATPILALAVAMTYGLLEIGARLSGVPARATISQVADAGGMKSDPAEADRGVAGGLDLQL